MVRLSPPFACFGGKELVVVGPLRFAEGFHFEFFHTCGFRNLAYSTVQQSVDDVQQ